MYKKADKGNMSKIFKADGGDLVHSKGRVNLLHTEFLFKYLFCCIGFEITCNVQHMIWIAGRR
jgi:hypothetical protein